MGRGKPAAAALVAVIDNMKRVLIISPQFPPVNSADMHRVRQSLPYFGAAGWEPVVIAVEERSAGAYSRDERLLETIPGEVEVHHVKALPEQFTRRFGLGSLSIRAAWHIYRKGCRLLRGRKFDLVYFSTTAFHVMALGPLWKRKFGVPFILDIQDPWRNDFYLSKPAHERPPKFWLSYNLDKYLEAFTVPKADGIISVSAAYCDTFLERYPSLRATQCRVIPFGAAMADLDVLEKMGLSSGSIHFQPGKINVVYAGRGGHDLRFALSIIFSALAMGKAQQPDLFNKLHCWFAGTSYAKEGAGKKTVEPVAAAYGVQDQVTEITARLPYFETLQLLQQADMLLVPGSTDTAYTASKIYPYVMMRKPMLAVFNRHSGIVDFLKDNGFGYVLSFDHTCRQPEDYTLPFFEAWKQVLENGQSLPDMNRFGPFTARQRTFEQTAFFDEILRQRERPVSASQRMV